ncbi:hypothetical protein VTN02DRAFT_6141 [Thermoascus thermophilus]
MRLENVLVLDIIPAQRIPWRCWQGTRQMSKRFAASAVLWPLSRVDGPTAIDSAGITSSQSTQTLARYVPLLIPAETTDIPTVTQCNGSKDGRCGIPIVVCRSPRPSTARKPGETPRLSSTSRWDAPSSSPFCSRCRPISLITSGPGPTSSSV